MKNVGFIRSESLGVLMERVWEQHEVSLLERKKEYKLALETSERGLNSNAQEMHDKFLLNLHHLSEVQRNHQDVVYDISIDLDEAKMKSREINSIDEIVKEFGGEITEKIISLNYPSDYHEKLIVQTTKDDDSQLVRIMSSEVFGGLLRTFKLPPGKELEKVIWNNGNINLLLM